MDAFNRSRFGFGQRLRSCTALVALALTGVEGIGIDLHPCPHHDALPGTPAHGGHGAGTVAGKGHGSTVASSHAHAAAPASQGHVAATAPVNGGPGAVHSTRRHGSASSAVAPGDEHTGAIAHKDDAGEAGEPAPCTCLGACQAGSAVPLVSIAARLEPASTPQSATDLVVTTVAVRPSTTAYLLPDANAPPSSL